MTYKEMTADDIAGLSALYVEAFNAPPWNDAWTMETARIRLRQIISAEDFYGLCAYLGGELCGMILGGKEQYFNGIHFYIREFCVKPGMRGTGLGTQILAEFEDRLKAQGVKNLYLLTAKGGSVEDFYAKRGHKTNDNMVIMSKRL